VLTMNVSLTPELEELVNRKVTSGMYHSASEVIREGLRLLKEQDILREARLSALRQDIEEGERQIANGQFTEYASGKEAMDSIMQQVAARRAARKSDVTAEE